MNVANWKFVNILNTRSFPHFKLSTKWEATLHNHKKITILSVFTVLINGHTWKASTETWGNPKALLHEHPMIVIEMLIVSPDVAFVYCLLSVSIVCCYLKRCSWIPKRVVNISYSPPLGVTKFNILSFKKGKVK